MFSHSGWQDGTTCKTNWVFRLFSYFYSNRVRSYANNLTLITLIDKVIPSVDVGLGGFGTMSNQGLNMNYCKADCTSDNTKFCSFFGSLYALSKVAV